MFHIGKVEILFVLAQKLLYKQCTKYKTYRKKLVLLMMRVMSNG